CYVRHRALLSFPTRRSSDLGLNNFSPILFGIVLTASWQFLVIFGLHWGIVPIGYLQLSELGYSTIFAQVSTSTFAVFGVLLAIRSEEHTSELQSRFDLVCRL